MHSFIHSFNQPFKCMLRILDILLLCARHCSEHLGHSHELKQTNKQTNNLPSCNQLIIKKLKRKLYSTRAQVHEIQVEIPQPGLRPLIVWQPSGRCPTHGCREAPTSTAALTSCEPSFWLSGAPPVGTHRPSGGSPYIEHLPPGGQCAS